MKKLLVIFLAVFLLTACAHTDKPDGDGWYMGFGSAEISVPDGGDLYIAGFHNGKKISGVSDTPCANAVWADVGTGGRDAPDRH